MIFECQGQHFDLLPERAVFWQERKILFCSDLHWGREAYLQKFGFAIPDQSFKQESRILSTLIQKYEPEEWWILGDFIHHPQGLHAPLLQEISQWMQSLPLGKIKLIPGNHDRALADWTHELPIEIHAQEIEDSGFLFRHDPPAQKKARDAEKFSWYGHLHPSISVGNLISTGKLPCFWIREKLAYIPAFSRLAGGAEIGRLQENDRVWVVAEDEVIELTSFP